MYRNNFRKQGTNGGKPVWKKGDFNKRNKCSRRVGDYVEGKVQGSGKGFAFLIPSDGGEDLFIAARDLFGAIHGDDVVAKVTGTRRGGGECEVLKVLKRNVTDVVGVFDGFGVDSIERGLGTVKVEFTGGVRAQKGDKVVAKIMDGSPVRCKITEVLGKEGDTLADIMGVIRSYKLREDFPAAVIKETAAIPDEVTDAEEKGRRDFRDDIVVTVDGATSKDFDDAISVVKKPNGYRLFVHIADVAEYVKENTPLDREAIERGTSVYFADRVLPMLPEKLSNGICSLNEGVDRLAMSCVMDFDGEGNIVSHEICEGVIRSKARMTYDWVESIFAGEEEAIRRADEKNVAIVPMLTAAKELAELLMKKRAARGSVEFDIEESEIVMGENGKVLDVRKRARLFSHKLIEEFMLAANETVAEHFATRKAPFVYRVHEVPPLEKVESLNDYLAAFGLSVPDKPAPEDYARLIESLDESVKGAVNRVALRSMSKAEYKPECLGHFGLAAEYYCHFTSPIRRYPDLAIHRIIKYFLRGGADAKKKFGAFVSEASVKSSEREKIAEEAERKVDDLLKAKFMQDKIGEKYTAVVSGVTEWGLFCELDNSVEGMIRVETLGNNFKYDEKRMLLGNGVRAFRMGDSVKIRVEAVNYDRISFVLDEDESKK